MRFLVVVLLTATLACGDGGPVETTDATAAAAFEAVAWRGETTPFDGYTLFQPMHSTSIYLVDMDGEPVHEWETDYNPGQSVYLLDNGNLLRAARDPQPTGSFRGGGEGGIVQEIAWDGTVVWEYKLSDETFRQHHDVEPMPNGNVLVIAWESRTYEEAVAAGINPSRMESDFIWPDFIVEIEPVYPDRGDVVWEWHAWDHLVQELYRDKANYGVVAEHPELIDINAAPAHTARQQIATQESLEQLRSLGYIAGSAETDDRPEIGADWLHLNSVDYNAELDQVLLSSRHFSEVWIVDHSTTTEEAAGKTGGRWGKGGDLLYRWGNPEAWSVGGPDDRQLFVQHDAQWIGKGLPGAGNILIFNNGAGRADGNYSSVDEIAPPTDTAGNYLMVPEEPSAPLGPVWTYVAPDKESLFSGMLSGAQRLPNGNTLIAEGARGRMLEVGAENAVVWELLNPFAEDEDQFRDMMRRAFAAPGGESGEQQEGSEGPRAGRGGRRGPPPGGFAPGMRDGPGGRRGPGGTGGMPQPGGMYKATRIPRGHPGLARLRTEGPG